LKNDKLKFFRFYEYIAEVTENQNRDNKEKCHGILDFIKKINGFEKDPETDQRRKEQEKGHHNHLF
jgi:hypothetical protein